MKTNKPTDPNLTLEDFTHSSNVAHMYEDGRKPAKVHQQRIAKQQKQAGLVKAGPVFDFKKAAMISVSLAILLSTALLLVSYYNNTSDTFYVMTNASFGFIILLIMGTFSWLQYRSFSAYCDRADIGQGIVAACSVPIVAVFAIAAYTARFRIEEFALYMCIMVLALLVVLYLLFSFVHRYDKK